MSHAFYKFTVFNRTAVNIYDWVNGIEHAISLLDDLNTGQDTTLFQNMIDLSRIGVIGHSMGAMAAVISAAQDARIKVLSLLAPADKTRDVHTGYWVLDAYIDCIDWVAVNQVTSQLRVPTQIIVGDQDVFSWNSSLNPENAKKILFDTIPADTPKELVLVKNGTHCYFLDNATVTSGSLLDLYFDFPKSIRRIISQYNGVVTGSIIEISEGILGEASSTLSVEEQHTIALQNINRWLNDYL